MPPSPILKHRLSVQVHTLATDCMHQYYALFVYLTVQRQWLGSVRGYIQALLEQTTGECFPMCTRPCNKCKQQESQLELSQTSMKDSVSYSSREINCNIPSAFAIDTGEILANLDLAKYFDFVMASSEVKTAKPDPRCCKPHGPLIASMKWTLSTVNGIFLQDIPAGPGKGFHTGKRCTSCGRQLCKSAGSVCLYYQCKLYSAVLCRNWTMLLQGRLGWTHCCSVER